MRYAFIKFLPEIESDATSRRQSLTEADRREDADAIVRSGALGEGHIALVKVNGPVAMIVDEWDREAPSSLELATSMAKLDSEIAALNAIQKGE